MINQFLKNQFFKMKINIIIVKNYFFNIYVKIKFFFRSYKLIIALINKFYKKRFRNAS